MPGFQDVKDIVRETLEEWILEIVEKHKYLSIGGLIDRVIKKHPEADEDDVKGVMWSLIVNKKIELTSRRRLRKI